MSKIFSKDARKALNVSLVFARDMGHMYIGTEHLLLGLLAVENSTAFRMLDFHRITFDRTKELIAERTGTGDKSAVGCESISPRLHSLIEASFAEANEHADGVIATEHILMAMAKDRDCLAAGLILSQGCKPDELQKELSAYYADGNLPGECKRRPTEKKNENSPLLAYGRDLTALAAQNKLDPVLCRERETMRLIEVLSRRTKNNPCLIGEPGVGKTAVVEGLARLICEGRVPESLAGKRIISLDLASMVAGAKYRGEFEERIKNVLRECARQNNVVLFVDELHTVVGAGGAEGAFDAANIIKPALARSEIRMIGATTTAEYRRQIEKDAALERRLTPILVDEPDEVACLTILKGLRERYEAHHGVSISDDALRAAITLSRRYIRDRFLPDKAIDLIDESAARKRMAACLQDKNRTPRDLADLLTDENPQDQYCVPSAVEREDIARTVSERTGIPMSEVTARPIKKSELASRLNETVIGQKQAVSALASAVSRFFAGLKDPRRPIGSFLFVGPSGVGKTRLARALADVLFKGKNALLSFDMSEYTEAHSISKLIGAPPGYVGHEEGGKLTTAVRNRPYGVILFDEVEKAHPDIFNLLLQILEDGRLTDSLGRTADFANTVVIMTSNAIGKAAASVFETGFSASDRKLSANALETKLRAFFKPELLDRIDAIIPFAPLSDDDMKNIARKMLADEKARISEANIHIEFDESIVDYLAGDGRIRGARTIRRTIEREVEDLIAEKLCEGEIAQNDSLCAYADKTGVFCTKL